MERKVFLCLDCQAIFYDGGNHRCPKVDKLHFISKLGVGKKHAEDMQGSIPPVFQYNGIGQVEGLNYSSAFSSFTNSESQLNAEYLQNISDGSNAYTKAQPEEHRDIPVMKTSTENIFDLSFYQRNQVSLRRNDENSLASGYLVGVQSRPFDTRQETTNYSTVPGDSSQVHEFQNNSTKNIKKFTVRNYMQTSILYEQEGLNGSSFSGGTTSGEYCSTTGFLFFNTDSRGPDSYESMNERNNLRSTNIPEPNCISKNFDFLPMQKDEAPHLQRSPHVVSKTGDMLGKKLAANDASRVSANERQPIESPSDGNVENYYEFKDGRFSCILCEKSYTVKSNLIIHYRTHTGDRPYACDQCPKTFIAKQHLNAHYKIHSEERPFPCEMCEKRFSSQVDLDKHQLIHSAERPYACGECTKRFSDKSTLDVHLRTHTGEKPFSCHMCDKRFNQQTNLTAHLQTHSGVKTFPCDMCDKRYASKQSLDRHRKIHFRD